MTAPRAEQELVDCTIDLATRCGWSVHHDRPARRVGRELRSGPKWHTTIQGHAGFPDLVLARAGVVLFREFKGYDKNGRVGRLSSEQRDWGSSSSPAGRSPASSACSTRQVPPALKAELRAQLLFDVWTPAAWDIVIVPTLPPRSGASHDRDLQPPLA